MHAHADLEDALVQVANLAGGRPPQQLERLVLLEELARVELVDGLQQGGRRGFGTQAPKVSRLEPLEGES